MDVISELYLGIIIGLTISLQTFLCNLPQDRVGFAASFFCLYALLGDFWKIILVLGVAAATSEAFKQSDPLVEHFTEVLVGIFCNIYYNFKNVVAMHTGYDLDKSVIKITKTGSQHLNNLKDKLNDTLTSATNKIGQFKNQSDAKVRKSE